MPGVGDTIHLCVVVSLQPLTPNAEVAGEAALQAALPGITLHPPQMAGETCVKPAATASPSSMELLFTILFVCQLRSGSRVLILFSKSVTE